MKEEELHLWLQVRNNYRPAFNELYQQSIDGLWSYAQRFTSDNDLIKDSIQEVYLDLWSKRHRIEIKTSFRFYLLKTFRRALLKKMQERKKIEAMAFEARLYRVPSYEEQLISAEEKKQKIQQLAIASQSLTPRQQEALYLKFHQQLASPAIAEIMGLQTSAVYKLISTALIRLRKHF